MSISDDEFEILESIVRPEVVISDAKTDLEHRLGWVVDLAMKYSEKSVASGALSALSVEQIATLSYQLAQLVVDTARGGYQDIQMKFAAHVPGPAGDPS